MGFAIPLTAWLRGPLRDWAESLIGNGSSSGEWLNRQVIQMMWRNFLFGDSGLTDKVWSLLMFQAWMKSEESCAVGSMRPTFSMSPTTRIFQ
jgi:asparagine synthase (glutamine-hydrolysing)